MKKYIKLIFVFVIIMSCILGMINLRSYAVVDESQYSLAYNYDDDSNYVGKYYVPIGSSYDIFKSLYLKGENGNVDIKDLDISNFSISDELSSGNIEIKKEQNSITYTAIKEGADAIHCEYKYNGETYTTDIQLNVCNMEDTFSDGHTAFIASAEETLEKGSSTAVMVDLCAFNREVNVDDYNTYYSVEWSSADDSIVEVTSESQGAVNQGNSSCVNYRATANIKGISAGETNVYCKIKNTDNEEIIKKIKVKVEGSSTSQSYKLVNNDLILIGPNMSLKELGKEITLPISLINDNLEKQDLNINNMTVTISDENIGTIVSKKLNNEDKKEMIINIKTISEGNINVDIKYFNELDRKEYKLSQSFIVYNPEDKFESTYQWATISNTILKMKQNETKKIVANVVSIGTYAVEYPDGYNASNYYKYEWFSLNENIAKIEKDENENTVKVTAVSPGNTEVYCTIKTADGKETIKKTVKVNVTGDSEEKEQEQDKEQEKKEEQEENEEKSKESDDKKDNTVSTNILAKTGEKVILPISIVLLIIMSIVFFKKSRM